MSIAKKLKASTKKSSTAKTIPHLIIEARAGTGKTTTLIEGLKKLKGVVSDHPASKNPSPQQKAIYDSLLLSRSSASTVAFVAFNKSIADELKQRVPQGCDAMTSHSLGRRSIADAFGNDHCGINNDRTQDIISELLRVDIWDLRRTKHTFLKACQELVDLCKQNLVHPDPPEECVDYLDKLCSHYEVELGDCRSEIYYWVSKILERSKDIQKDRCISFTDMIWLPIALNLPIYKYDLLLVDEAQDLNRCQQELAKRAGKRLVLCGDPKQAIYGFAGADSDSMPRMLRELSETPQGCISLPLNYTRRCGKAIVMEANKIVPDFYACEENGSGRVSRAGFSKKEAEKNTEGQHYRNLVEDGDMVLCRTNAPLVSECFKFLRDGRKANIQGRDIGQGLIKTIRSLEKRSGLTAYTIGNLISDLSKWRLQEVDKELKKKYPSDTRIMSLNDRDDCLQCFCEDAKTVQHVIDRIEAIFSDEKKGGVRLSSVHKAKGLEANRVFILLPEGVGMPHPMATSEWQVEQEWNLKYVAITRAIKELVWVS